MEMKVEQVFEASFVIRSRFTYPNFGPNMCGMKFYLKKTNKKLVSIKGCIFYRVSICVFN